VIPVERFAIVIASYNNEEYCINNIESAISQDYPQFKVIFIDDCSNDKTFSIVDRYIKEHAFDLEVRVIRNTVRKGAAQNYYEAIHNYTDNGEIIVILDGDDELAHPCVLKKLNEVYRSPDKDIWLTYGQFINKSDGSLGFCSAYPEEVQKRGFYRHYHHIPSHLKTFKSWLFKKIQKNDFMYKGSFMPMTWDMASMIPMMEMAGEKHHQFISEVLYIYNDLNPSSDHRISKKLQMEIDEYIRARRSYRAVADEPKNCR
jgi:glycosyltransferase involved in cell wall biosynthesis